MSSYQTCRCDGVDNILENFHSHHVRVIARIIGIWKACCFTRAGTLRGIDNHLNTDLSPILHIRNCFKPDGAM